MQAKELFTICQHGKYGYMDVEGKVVIDPLYQYAGDFSEGLADVSIEGKTGYIDRTGKMVIDPQFDSGSKFSEGVAGIRIGELYGRSSGGYIDKTGRIVIPTKFVDVGDFRDGLAMVEPNYHRCGYIDTQGEYRIEPRYYAAEWFSEGLAAVQEKESGPWGYIDVQGKYVAQPKYSAGWFSQGLAPIVTNIEFGDDGDVGGIVCEEHAYIDRTGRIAISGPFTFATQFSQDIAIVCKGGNWSVIDKSGNTIANISCGLDGASSFSEGLAAVRIRNKCGFLDATGRLAIPPTFKEADDFCGGLAKAGNDLWDDFHYVDRQGNTVSPAQSSKKNASPATARSSQAEMGEKAWFIRPKRGLKTGPFTTEELLALCSQQEFESGLRIRSIDDKHWCAWSNADGKYPELEASGVLGTARFKPPVRTPTSSMRRKPRGISGAKNDAKTNVPSYTPGKGGIEKTHKDIVLGCAQFAFIACYIVAWRATGISGWIWLGLGLTTFFAFPSLLRALWYTDKEKAQERKESESKV